jgi:3'-5' exonuclease
VADYRVIDIETVPDTSVWTPPSPRYSWAREEQGSSLSGEPGEPYLLAEEPFPPPQAHRIVSIAHIDLTSDDSRYYFFAGAGVSGSWPANHDLGAWNVIEKGLISEFVALQKDQATLVTWNGRTFDLPVINMRAFRHGIAMPWFYQQDGMRYRYSEVGHCDLMDVFSDYGAARNMKLGDVARCMGLPGKFGEVTGGSVAAKVYSKTSHANFAEVNRYCLSDVFQTAFLFVRSRYHKGMIDREEYNRAVESFSLSLDCQKVMPPDFNLHGLLLPR